MPVMPTNEAGLKELPIPEVARVDYFHPQAKKLVLRVTANGVKSWTIVYRFAAQQPPDGLALLSLQSLGLPG
jgi:hypothetical protein